MLRDWKTTVSGLCCLVSVIAYLLGKISLDSCVTLLGVCGAAIGIAGKDGTAK